MLRRLHASSGVRTRHLALPIEGYAALRDFRESNEAWLTAGLDLAGRALTTALDQAGLAPADVDLLVCASITGVAAPSLDARLAGRIGLRPDVKRLPVFGLGCAAGAAGLARVHDYLRGHPGETAVLLTVELCSLTLQKGDDSRANLVAGALFGDGAAALVARATATGTEAEPAAPSGPAVVATRSHLYPDTGHLLGWDVGAGGFRVVIDPGVPALVRRHLGAQVRGFLAEHGLDTGDIGAWVPPGRPQGAQGRGRRARPARRRPHPVPALARRRRQPVLRLGPAHPPGLHRGPPARAGHLGTGAGDGPWVRFRTRPAALVRWPP